MSDATFDPKFYPCCAFTLSPLQDGQPYHVTPGDSGGPTAWGITEETYARHLGHVPTAADWQKLTPEVASTIYHSDYWLPIQGDIIPFGIDLMVFDHGVTAGTVTTIKLLQDVMRVASDGVIGPQTTSAIYALAGVDQHTFIGKLAWRQESYYRSLNDFASFGNGWLARLDRRAVAAVDILTRHAAVS